MATTLHLTSLDEAFLNLTDTTVMSVQFEVRVSGRLDADRLAGALRTAVQRHPLARARLAPAALGDTRRSWEIDEVADHLSLEVTDEDAAAVRTRLQSRVPDLSRSPAFAVALVREDAGDLLMFNFHHVAFDGMSAVRLLTSVARAYNGEDDPTGGPELATARDLQQIAGSRSVTDLLTRAGALIEDIATRRTEMTRIAPDRHGPAGADGFTFATLLLDSDDMGKVVAAKPPGTTINDLLLAGLALTIRRWNADHEAPGGDRVSIMMPVNMRPADWSAEVISNFASYLAIAVSGAVDDKLTAATVAVRDRTRPLKEKQVAGWIIDILERGNAIPVFLKQRLQRLLPLVQGRFIETTVLSNLGRIGLPPFGDAGAVREIWFSPPLFGEMMPASVGVASVDRQMCLTVRTQRSALDDEAAQRFAGNLRDTLVNG